MHSILRACAVVIVLVAVPCVGESCDVGNDDLPIQSLLQVNSQLDAEVTSKTFDSHVSRVFSLLQTTAKRSMEAPMWMLLVGPVIAVAIIMLAMCIPVLDDSERVPRHPKKTVDFIHGSRAAQPATGGPAQGNLRRVQGGPAQYVTEYVTDSSVRRPAMTSKTSARDMVDCGPGTLSPTLRADASKPSSPWARNFPSAQYPTSTMPSAGPPAAVTHPPHYGSYVYSQPAIIDEKDLMRRTTEDRRQAQEDELREQAQKMREKLRDQMTPAMPVSPRDDIFPADPLAAAQMDVPLSLRADNRPATPSPTPPLTPETPRDDRHDDRHAVVDRLLSFIPQIDAKPATSRYVAFGGTVAYGGTLGE